MQTIAEEALSLFIDRAQEQELLPTKGASVLDRLKEDFIEWQDHMTAESYEINHPDFDKAYLFVLNSRSKRERRTNSQVVKMAAAGVRANGILVMRGGVTRIKQLQELREQPALLIDWARNVNAYEAVVFNDPLGLDGYVRSALSHTATRIRSLIQHSYRAKNHKKTLARDAGMLAREVVLDVTGVHYNGLLEDLAEQFDKASLDAVRHNTVGTRKDVPTVITLFNQVVSKEDLRERDYRRGAAVVLSTHHRYFLDDQDLWTKIDEGQSPHKALAEKFGVRPSTMKEIYKRQDVFSCGNIEFGQMVQTLDAIDPAHWPKDKEDYRYLSLIAKLVFVDEKYFGGAFNHYIGEHDKEKRLAKHITWQSYFEQKMLPYREAATRSSSDNHRHYANPRMPNSDKSKRFEDDLIGAYQASVRNIKDMKADVQRKIVIPAVIVMLGQAGYQVLKIDGLSPITDEIDQRVWSGTPRSEQIAASAYWHSPRVNFGERINSVAYTLGADASWDSLIHLAIKAPNGVVLHPLTSDAQLKEEGKEMGHCVGGYAYSCLKRNYHIFSLRDERDKHLSTLSVVDFIKDGKRQIRFAENSAQRNASAPEPAKEAANWFIKAVNEGKIEPDWATVDTSRADFLAKEVDIAVGYDFRVEGARERIFEVFEPCLPRKSLRRGRTADLFLENLGLGKVVEQYVSTAKLVELGIRQLPSPERPIAEAANNQPRLEQ